MCWPQLCPNLPGKEEAAWIRQRHPVDTDPIGPPVLHDPYRLPCDSRPANPRSRVYPCTRRSTNLLASSGTGARRSRGRGRCRRRSRPARAFPDQECLNAIRVPPAGHRDVAGHLLGVTDDASRLAAPRASSLSVTDPPSPRRTRCVLNLRQCQRANPTKPQVDGLSDKSETRPSSAVPVSSPSRSQPRHEVAPSILHPLLARPSPRESSRWALEDPSGYRTQT
jgi:hypothetical protein